MHISNLRQANYLTGRRERLIQLMKTLNDINGTSDDDVSWMESIPSDVLSFVDQRCAAKGLLSLVLEELSKIEKKMYELGLELGE